MIGHFSIRYAVPAILLAACGAYLAFFNGVMLPVSKSTTDRLVRSAMVERVQNLQAGLGHAYSVSDDASVDLQLFYASADRQSRNLFLLDESGTILKAHTARFEGLDIKQLDADFDHDKAVRVLEGADVILSDEGDYHFSAYAKLYAGQQQYLLYMTDDYRFYAAEITRLTSIPERMGAGLLLAAVVLLAFFLHFTLSGRLKKLTRAANAVARGQADIRTSLKGRDEVAQLGKVFDHMASGVDKERAELKVARAEADFASRAKSDFLANMSHEIRTPLTGVLGMLEALKALDLSKDARRFAVMANRSAYSLLDLINDILDFSRLEAGKKSLRPAPMNMATVVKGVYDTLVQQAITKDIELDCKQAMATPLWIDADEKSMRQILMNFMSNAIKFTNEGRVRVTVEASEREDGRLDVHVSVSDTGGGIEPTDLKRLFDRFEQVEEFKHSQKGTGLGLAICRELVALMKGKIWAESKVGKGSAFHISVPVEKSDSYEEVDTLTNVDISSFKRPLRVLAVDDNQINRTVIYQTLTILGLKAFVAEDGQAAIDLVKRQLARNLKPFDIILMDIHMPGMDGLDTMDQIRKLGDWASRIPIIALTAHAFADQKAEFLERGMVGYVSKPIDRNALALEIAKTSDKLNLLVHKKKKVPLKKKTAGRIRVKLK